MNAIDGDWHGGAAILPFAIVDGTPLTGYMAREGPAEGTLDPLTVGALVLERDGERMVVVAADLAAVDGELVQEIAGAAGIARSQLALCASHTHSGPAGVVARLHPASPDALDPALRARFVGTVAEAIAAARRDLQPVALRFAMTAVEGVAGNRNDSAISADERLSVVATRRADGSIHCVVVHFACHPTILGAASQAVSADFPGALRRRLADLLTQGDSAPVVLYVNGAAGDLSTRFTRRAQDAAEVERLGGELAVAARDALRYGQSLDGLLRHGSTSVALQPRSRVIPSRVIPSGHAAGRRHHGRKIASTYVRGISGDFPSSVSETPPSVEGGSGGGQSRHDANSRSPEPRSLLRRDDIGGRRDDTEGGGCADAASSPGLRRIAETRAQGAAMLAALAALPEGAVATRCHLDAWALGELVLVSVPGELFASLGHQIAESSKPTLVLGYTNGYIGYLADHHAHEAGTYEALASPYGPEDGERVVAAAVALADRLRSERDMMSRRP